MDTGVKCDWKEYISTGEYYYFNENTGETVWEKPKEYSNYEKTSMYRKNEGETKKKKIKSLTLSLFSIYIKRILWPSIDIYSDALYVISIAFGAFSPIEIDKIGGFK